MSDPCDLEELLDGLGGLRALREPGARALGVDLDDGGVGLRHVAANRLDALPSRGLCESITTTR